jgi:Mrp family chromosome partitioning ATPase
MTALGLCLLALLLSLCPAAVAAETSEATSPNAELASAPKAAESPKDSSPAPTNKTDDAIDSIVSIALYATGAILAALGVFFYLQRVRRARVLAPARNKNNASHFLYDDLLITEAPSPDNANATESNNSLNPFSIPKELSASLDALWSNVMLQQGVSSVQIAFCGCDQNVGVSFVSFHLAALAAQQYGFQVLYVDASNEQKKSGVLNFKGCSGFVSHLLHGAPLDSFIRKTKIPNLSVLHSGVAASGVSAGALMLKTPESLAMMRRLREKFAIVIYDCEPPLSSAWSLFIMKEVGAVVMVSRYAKSRKEVCAKAIEKLKANNIEPAGIVINQRSSPMPMIIDQWLK